jgi:hypothetical protein
VVLCEKKQYSMVLGARQFVTFDAGQTPVALEAGLEVPELAAPATES